MARQLVFTSAPSGLTPGRTGFCTVARHADLRERLVPLLESLSVYPSDWRPAPVICAFRMVDLAGARIPVLTRVVDAGYDYTHRTNFLAHHLILDPAELANAPTPAEVFLRWPGWLNKWDAAPRWFADTEQVDLARLPALPTAPLPAATWAKLTGDAGRAALLLDGAHAASHVLRYNAESEGDMLALLRESSALLTSAEAWRTEFITCLQANDSVATFRWAGLRADYDAVVTQRGSALLDLATPSTLPAAPASGAASQARDGKVFASSPVSAAPISRPALTIPAAVPVTKPSPVRAASPSPAPTSPAPTVRAPSKPASSGNGTMIAIAAVLILIVIGGALWMGLRGGESSTPSANVSTPPMTPALPAPPTPPSATDMLQSANNALENEGLMQDVEKLVGEGHYLDALEHWKKLADTAPDLAKTHATYLQTPLLPGARKEWQSRLDQVQTQINEGKTDRKTLTAQLDALKDFPHAWPVANADALIHSWDATAAILKLLDSLPDGPMTIVDNFTRAGANADYEDISFDCPDALQNILTGDNAGLKISCAAASSILPPPPEQWFHFDIKPADFQRGNYLILHDTTRGIPDGAFLQLLADDAKHSHLTWRIFNWNSDFFRNNRDNALLRAPTGSLWLHIEKESAPRSLYILLQHPAAAGSPTWGVLTVPERCLVVDGAPAKVSLPDWLTKNFSISTTHSFHLLPANNGPARQAAFAIPAAQNITAMSNVQFQASWVLAPMQQSILNLQINLSPAKQTLASLENLATGPLDKRPAQATIDRAKDTVDEMQQSYDSAKAAAEAVAKPDWPHAVAPWTLYYGSDAAKLTPLIEFLPNETGPTP